MGSRPSRSLNLLLVLAALVALVLSTAAIVAAIPPAPVKLGLVAPFSGRDADLGRQLIGAVWLALAEREAAGMARQPIELVAYDESGNREQAIGQARKLVVDPQTVAVLGHPGLISAESAAPVYRAAGLPAWLTALGLAGAADGPVRAVGPAPDAVGAAVDRFRDLAAAGTLVLVMTPVAAEALPALADHPGWADRLVIADPEESVVRRIAGRGGAIVYAGDTPGAGRLVRRLRAAGWSDSFLFVSVRGSAAGFDALAGPPAAGLYYVAPVAVPDPEFASRFREATGLAAWPEARETYRLTVRVLERIDLAAAGGLVSAAAQEASPNRPSADRVLRLPRGADLPKPVLGIFAVAPGEYPGRLIATVE